MNIMDSSYTKLIALIAAMILAAASSFVASPSSSFQSSYGWINPETDPVKKHLLLYMMIIMYMWYGLMIKERQTKMGR